jgi:hypothetical protein
VTRQQLAIAGVAAVGVFFCSHAVVNALSTSEAAGATTLTPTPSLSPSVAADTSGPRVTSRCHGFRCTLTVLGGGHARYDWAFGDGSTAHSTNPSVTHSYGRPGVFTASVVTRVAGQPSPPGHTIIRLQSFPRTLTLSSSAADDVALTIRSVEPACRPATIELQRRVEHAWQPATSASVSGSATSHATLSTAGFYRGLTPARPAPGGVCEAVTSAPVRIAAPPRHRTHPHPNPPATSAPAPTSTPTVAPTQPAPPPPAPTPTPAPSKTGGHYTPPPPRP